MLCLKFVKFCIKKNSCLKITGESNKNSDKKSVHNFCWLILITDRHINTTRRRDHHNGLVSGDDYVVMLCYIEIKSIDHKATTDTCHLLVMMAEGSDNLKQVHALTQLSRRCRTG